MKKTGPFFLLIALSVVLTACPFESFYSIDAEPTMAIDESLLGKWAAFVKRPSTEGNAVEKPVKLILDKRSEMEYDFAITGYLDELKPYRLIVNDSIKGTAFLSEVAGKQFLNAIINGRFYLAEVQKTSNTLSLKLLAESFTAKYPRSNESLRASIEYHYKTRLHPSYDEWLQVTGLQKVK